MTGRWSQTTIVPHDGIPDQDQLSFTAHHAYTVLFKTSRYMTALLMLMPGGVAPGGDAWRRRRAAGDPALNMGTVTH